MYFLYADKFVRRYPKPIHDDPWLKTCLMRTDVYSGSGCVLRGSEHDVILKSRSVTRLMGTQWLVLVFNLLKITAA